MRLHGLVLATALLSAPALVDAETMPLKRVRLYETGVGYYERAGSTAGGALPVPAGHLDDALKTLVVMAKDGNTAIDGIEFTSSVSRGTV